MSLIEIENLLVSRNGTTICRVPRLAVEPGERLAVLGDNGSGKTTLLRVLAGLERRYAGRCAVAASSRQRIYVDQSPLTFRGTVLFNAMYGLRAHGVPRRAARAGALGWLERFGIAELAAANVRRLSGGEVRRLALARAVAVRPRLLLLDEPLAEMDGAGAACVRRALAELADTTILVTCPTTLPESLCAREFRLATSRSA